MPLAADPPAVNAADWEARSAARTAAHAQRVAEEMAQRGERFIPRGRARRVVRNDHAEYESVSAAARANGVKKTDNICQSIRRQGTCGGWRWAYLGEEPAGFYGPVQASAPIATLFPLTPRHSDCWPRYANILPPPPVRPLRPAA